jgi:hypothetical protein
VEGFNCQNYDFEVKRCLLDNSILTEGACNSRFR